MIQDIKPRSFDPSFCGRRPADEDYLLHYKYNKVMLKKEGDGFSIPRFGDVKKEVFRLEDKVEYLFSIDDRAYFGVWEMECPDFTDLVMEGLQIFQNFEPMYQAFAGITGSQIYRWRQSRRYCGCCGAPMAHSRTERQMYCPACGHYEYPVLSPAVIVGITNGDRLVMSKYEGRTFTNYALIAGYAEIGETIEDTVRREVMEEVGLRVKNIRYYKSQPSSFSGTLLFGFFCDVDGDDTLTVDHSELAMAEWFHRSEIRGQGNSSSLTNEMMLVFAEGKEPR